MLVLDRSCRVCAFEEDNPGRRLHDEAHTCGRKRVILDVGRCVLKGKDEWSFVADVVFMPKAAVPKVLGRPHSRGEALLKTASPHYQKHHVYKTKDVNGDTVYYAHEGSL